MSISCGIDLGTTYSSISYYREDLERVETVALNHAEGKPIISSAVYMGPEGNPVVGTALQNAQTQHPEYVIEEVKRFLGVDYLTCPDSRTYRPCEVASEILKVLKADAESCLKETIDEVVVAVPVCFDERERQAILEAGRLAGLKILALIPEPRAVALAVAKLHPSKLNERNILVYELGGGTFAVSLIDYEAGSLDINILTQVGDSNLGGLEWDRELARFTANKAVLQHNIPDPYQDIKSKFWLLKNCEQAKHDLCQKNSASILVDQAGHKVDVTREEFEMITGTLVARTEELLARILQEAEAKYGCLTKKRIGEFEIQDGFRKETAAPKVGLLLSGGATRMPMIQDSVAGLLGEQSIEVKNPDLLVTIGAAYYAYLLKSRTTYGAASSKDEIATSRMPKYTATQVIEMFQAIRLPVTDDAEQIVKKADELRPQYQREKNNPDPHARAKAERWYKNLVELLQNREELLKIVKGHFYHLADIALEARLQTVRRVVPVELHKNLEKLALEECRFDAELARSIINDYFFENSLSIGQSTQDFASTDISEDIRNPYSGKYSVADVIRLFREEINLTITDDLTEIQRRIAELKPKYDLMKKSPMSLQRERADAWFQTVKLVQDNLPFLIEIVRNYFFELADIQLYDALVTGTQTLPRTFGLKLEWRAKEDFKCAASLAKKLTQEYINNRNIDLDQQWLSSDTYQKLAAFQGRKVPYNRSRIHRFLAEKVDLEDFCFWLTEFKQSRFYAFDTLDGINIEKKSRALVTKAFTNDEVGDVLCELVRYWIEDYGGRTQVLKEAEIHQELGVFLRQSLDQENYEKADSIVALLKQVME